MSAGSWLPSTGTLVRTTVPVRQRDRPGPEVGHAAPATRTGEVQHLTVGAGQPFHGLAGLQLVPPAQGVPVEPQGRGRIPLLGLHAERAEPGRLRQVGGTGPEPERRAVGRPRQRDPAAVAALLRACGPRVDRGPGGARRGCRGPRAGRVPHPGTGMRSRAGPARSGARPGPAADPGRTPVGGRYRRSAASSWRWWRCGGPRAAARSGSRAVPRRGWKAPTSWTIPAAVRRRGCR